MRKLILSSLALSLLLATSAAAQESGAATPAPENGLSLGEPVAGADGIGQPYTAETHGDWSIRCIRTEDGNDPCRLYQLLNDQEGNSVAEISLFSLPEGQSQAVAGATIVTPLETLLTQQIRLQVDNGTAKRYPFTFCAPVGCVARVGFTAEDVDAFRKGATATLTVVPVAAPDQEVRLTVSLKGFTAGFAAIAEAQ